VSDVEKQPEEWPRVVRLAHPIDFGSERITALTFRRGKLGDLKGLKVDDVPSAADAMLLASRMCGQPLKVIEQLDADDASEVLEIALGFFGRCLQGGKTT
jgi:Phage tail assembly chaperone proteins, E, or 41 or 14